MIDRVNFLYLGGDKCGSTWLHYILDKHPDVQLASSKELFYFDRFYKKGPEWYARQFPDNPAALRTGEICHDYLYSVPALERISLDMPADSRFLIFVRDPLERAISHYRYLRKIGKTSMSFDDAVSAYPQIVEHSLFGKYVASAVNLLGKERVHVLSFDDLKTDPEKFGEQVSKALDIPFLPGLPYSDRILEAAGSRAPILTRVLREVSWGLRGLGLATFVSRVKQSPLINKILFSTQKLDDREKSTPGAAVKRNLSEIFDRDLEQLGHLVGPNTLQSIKE